jgi:glutathione S-transferase
MEPAQKFELFHSITDGASARVRTFIMASNLQDHVRFRNMITGDEARPEYESFNLNGQLPVLRENLRTLFVGETACLERLKEFLLTL